MKLHKFQPLTMYDRDGNPFDTDWCAYIEPSWDEVIIRGLTINDIDICGKTIDETDEHTMTTDKAEEDARGAIEILDAIKQLKKVVARRWEVQPEDVQVTLSLHHDETRAGR